MFHTVIHLREDDLLARSDAGRDDRHVRARWVFILWLLGCIGLGGLHRFYLRKPKSGLLYLCTLSVFGVGLIWDFLFMPALVAEARQSLQPAMPRPLQWRL